MDILQGTLDLLILRALELAPMHGIGIAARIEQVTRGAIVVKPGSLFPALRRLEQQGWIAGEWAPRKTIAAPATTRSRAPAAASLPKRSATGTP